MSERLFKVVVTVPEANAEALRQVMGDVIGTVFGSYSHVSFSVKGLGRFVPLVGAKPAIGSLGQWETVVEERIEVTCPAACLERLCREIRKNHPYEEPVIDVFPLHSLG